MAGIDEAGRGALAGPVVAAACIVRSPLFARKEPFGSWSPVRTKRELGFCLIADSKKLTPKQREESLQWIQMHCAFGIGMTPAEDIDRIGILEATERAMQEALRNLATVMRPTYVLVDGRDKFWFDYPHSSIIRGDESESCIAAASIVAKVTRDRLMVASSKEFPQFGFEKHKGYGTELHYEALRQHSPCILHRRSFLSSAKHMEDTIALERL
ncbi:MAG TPA: ribonuclease HII [Candidatus Peribacteraceae bacterium]|nr:ribonuclease HII [Candidatus Peribacteraceae bacterium]